MAVASHPLVVVWLLNTVFVVVVALLVVVLNVLLFVLDADFAIVLVVVVGRALWLVTLDDDSATVFFKNAMPPLRDVVILAVPTATSQSPAA